MRRVVFLGAALAAFACAAWAAPTSAAPATRIIIGGKAVAMVADAAYLFPQARSSVVAVAGVDQGLGSFLGALDPGFAKKPVLDRAAGAEAFAAHSPDLVILKSSMRLSLGPGLDALGIRQLYLDLETPEDYLRELALLGEVFGAPDRAKALADFYRRSLDEVAARVARAAAARVAAGRAAVPRVLVVQAQSAPGGAFEVPPASWMQTIMAERAGAEPVWKGANPGSGWARVGIEQIAAWDPDLVFCISYKEKAEAVAAAFRADPRLAGLRAVSAGRVYGFPQDFYSWDQPDARWILGLGWMAKTVNPEAFAQVSTRAEAARFFEFCYGLGGAAFEALIAPRLSGDYGE